MNAYEKIREQAAKLCDPKPGIRYSPNSLSVHKRLAYQIRSMPLPEVSQKPAGYFKADQDGNLIWGEDCVCEDAQYDHDYGDGFKEISRPFYLLPPDAEALRAENERLKELLESAANGLRWYHDEYPDRVSESDYEMLEQIDGALEGGTE
jgi:hypothetical protein